MTVFLMKNRENHSFPGIDFQEFSCALSSLFFNGKKIPWILLIFLTILQRS